MVTIAVPRERAGGEHRVALVPESVRRLTTAGAAVRVERDAGAGARIADSSYEAAGATIHDDAMTTAHGADVIVRIGPPTDAEIGRYPLGATLVSLFPARPDDPVYEAIAAREIVPLALERVPRITRAQAMDVLSSQATVAGYKAALLGAMHLDRFLPMLTTAAGSIAPARVFVIGAGVAGLQAIATARRLGAVVSAFDIRPAAAEQVQSLGAAFVESEAVTESAEAAGGYAREQSDEQQRATLRTIAGHLPTVDLVITTAQIPGRPAPRLITREMLPEMKPGAIIIDLAAESGGNCEATRAGETVEESGVRVIGPVNLPATVPLHASQMFSRNVLALLQHIIRDGELMLDADDEIVAAMKLDHSDPART